MGLRGSISQEGVKLSIDKTSLKYNFLNLLQHLPGATELRSYWFLVDWRPLATTWRRSCSNCTTHGRMGIPTGLVLHDQPNGQHRPPRKKRVIKPQRIRDMEWHNSLFRKGSHKPTINPCARKLFTPVRNLTNAPQLGDLMGALYIGCENACAF